jgi:hypothetical protein
VQDRGGEHPRVVDAEDVADDEADAEGVAGVGGFAILAELALVRPRREGDGVQDQAGGGVRGGHQNSYSASGAIFFT